MDSGFSISLKKRGSSKKRLKNVFNNDDNSKSSARETLKVKRQKVRITHIDNPELDSERAQQEKELVIKISNNNTEQTNTEDETKGKLEKDPSEAAPSLEEYKKIPVELFGDAVLRGMGWNGEISESKSKNDKNKGKTDTTNFVHPDSLGIGAAPSSITTSKEPFMPIKKILKKEESSTNENDL